MATEEKVPMRMPMMCAAVRIQQHVKKEFLTAFRSSVVRYVLSICVIIFRFDIIGRTRACTRKQDLRR